MSHHPPTHIHNPPGEPGGGGGGGTRRAMLPPGGTEPRLQAEPGPGAAAAGSRRVPGGAARWGEKPGAAGGCAAPDKGWDCGCI